MELTRAKPLTAKQRAFLKALEITGSIAQSAAAARVNRNRHRGWLKESAVFSEAYDEAREVWADSLEAEAVRRAVEGTFDPIVQNGKQVIGPDGKPMFRNNRSDYLLGLLLKAHRPERYNPPGMLRTENKTLVAEVPPPNNHPNNIATAKITINKVFYMAERLKKLGFKPEDTNELPKYLPDS